MAADPDADPAAPLADGVHDSVAHGWVRHLLGGGTVTWAEHRRSGRAAEATGRLPGAQQLEVLRRLNLRGRPDPGLARAVLAAGPPGRGALDLPLLGLPAPPYGARPVDPAALEPDELLRVATGVIAERLHATELPERHGDSALARARELANDRLPRRHPFRLVGPVARVAPVRDTLRSLGRTPGGRGAVHHVLGADMGRLVTDAWSARVVEGRAASWTEWLSTWAERDTCPARADLAGIARAWSRRVGPDRVDVVLDAGELRHLLGLRTEVVAAPPRSAAAVELTRQVSAVLGVLERRPRRTRLLTEVLAARIGGASGDDDPPLVVGEEHRSWLVRAGRGLEQSLARGGYRVHGPTRLLTDPPRHRGVAEPQPDAVLGLALTALLTWSPADAAGARGAADRRTEEEP